MNSSEIDIEDLSDSMRTQLAGEAGNKILNGNGNYSVKISDFESRMIYDALNESNWNQSEAARKLGIPEQTLRYKMKKYNISKSNLHFS